MSERKKIKPVKAWAIMEHGKLAIYDGRLPVFWLRRIARKAAKEKCFEHKIVRVTVRIEP